MNKQENTFLKFVKLLGIKVNKSTLLSSVRHHPEFPGYNSISDFLTEINVENVTLEASVEELKNYPKPQLVQFKENGDDFAIVTETNNGSVKYLYNNAETVEPVTSFDEKWNHIVLLAEAGESSGEKNYSKNRRSAFLNKLRVVSIFLLLVLLIAFQLVELSGSNRLNFYPVIAILFTKAIGLAVSLLLLYETFFPVKNKLLSKICAIGKSVQCASVLQSKGAKLFGWLSWSEVGCLYFAGGFLVVLFAGNHPTFISFLALLALASVFYVFYSIYYQLFVVKHWCTLCLVVQVVFLAEVTLLFPFINIANGFSINLISKIAVCFLVPLLTWLIVKPFILKAVEATGFKKQLISFKRDKDTFAFKLSQQDQFTDTEGVVQPIWNETGAENHLVLVSNPYCGPCSMVYKQLNRLQKYFSQKLNVSIVYAVPNDENDLRYETAAYLLSLYQQVGLEKANEISKKWYQLETKNIKKLKREYPVNNKYKNNLIQKQTGWCMQNKISYTPVLLFNGYLLPSEYEIEDLIYFIN
jgi:uncharacterized membrane protein